MRFFCRGLILLCLLACVSACSKEPQTETKNVELAYYAGSTVPEEGYPLLTLENQGDILAYYRDKDRKNTASFLFQGEGCSDATVMYVAEDRIVIAPLSPNSRTVSPVIVLCAEEGFNYAFIGEVESVSGKYKINAVVPLTNSTQTKAAYNYGDDIRATLLRSFFDTLNKGKDRCEVLDVATGGITSPVTSMISNILTLDFVLAATELTDGAGDDLKHEVGQMSRDIVVDFFVGTAANVAATVIPVEGVRPLAARVLKKMLLGKGEVVTSDYAESRAEEAGPMLFSRMKKIVAPPTLFKYSDARAECPWDVSLSVLSVGYSSAVVKGYAKEAPGSDSIYDTLIDQGFETTCIRDGHVRKTSAPGLGETQLQLEPATEYSIVAFVKTFAGAKMCYSTPQRVCARGTRLVTSANELVFSSDGGSRTVGVEVGDCATWEVIGRQPSWCSATFDKTSVFIAVKSGKTEERCEVKLQTTSIYGETETKTIVVSRKKKNSWDGTMWDLHMTFQDQGSSGNAIQWLGDIPGSVNCKLYIENAAAGKYQSDMSMGDMRRDSDSALSFHQSSSETVEGPLKVWSDGRVEMGKAQVNREWSMKLTRTDDTHVSISGSIIVNVSGDWNGSYKIGIGGSGSCKLNP